MGKEERTVGKKIWKLLIVNCCSNLLFVLFQLLDIGDVVAKFYYCWVWTAALIMSPDAACLWLGVTKGRVDSSNVIATLWPDQINSLPNLPQPGTGPVNHPIKIHPIYVTCQISRAFSFWRVISVKVLRQWFTSHLVQRCHCYHCGLSRVEDY